MTFNVQKNAILIHENFNQKISLPWEGDPPPTPSFRSVASLPRFAPPPPLLKNPGYANDTVVLSWWPL